MAGKTVEEIIDILTTKAKDELRIDKSNLASSSLKTPLIHSSWMNAFNLYKRKLRQKEYWLKKIYKDRWLYYTGKADATTYAEEPFEYKIMKGDIHIFLESDEKLEAARQEVSDLKDIVSFIDSIVGEINRRSFHIKNALEAIRWANGG